MTLRYFLVEQSTGVENDPNQVLDPSVQIPSPQDLAPVEINSPTQPVDSVETNSPTQPVESAGDAHFAVQPTEPASTESAPSQLDNRQQIDQSLSLENTKTSESIGSPSTPQVSNGNTPSFGATR